MASIQFIIVVETYKDAQKPFTSVDQQALLTVSMPPMLWQAKEVSKTLMVYAQYFATHANTPGSHVNSFLESWSAAVSRRATKPFCVSPRACISQFGWWHGSLQHGTGRLTILSATPAAQSSKNFDCVLFHASPSRFHFATQVGRNFISGKKSTKKFPGITALVTRAAKSDICLWMGVSGSSGGQSYSELNIEDNVNLHRQEIQIHIYYIYQRWLRSTYNSISRSQDLVSDIIRKVANTMAFLCICWYFSITLALKPSWTARRSLRHLEKHHYTCHLILNIAYVHVPVFQGR